MVYCEISPKDKSSFGGTDRGLPFCKEINKICKNALFLEFLAYLHFVACKVAFNWSLNSTCDSY